MFSKGSSKYLHDKGPARYGISFKSGLTNEWKKIWSNPDTRVISELYLRRKLPETIDRYQIKEDLGRGQETVVYRAFDTETNREVAIKVLSIR